MFRRLLRPASWGELSTVSATILQQRCWKQRCSRHFRITVPRTTASRTGRKCQYYEYICIFCRVNSEFNYVFNNHKMKWNHNSDKMLLSVFMYSLFLKFCNCRLCDPILGVLPCKDTYVICVPLQGRRPNNRSQNLKLQNSRIEKKSSEKSCVLF